MKCSLLFRLFILVTAVMCALGVNAQEAYAVYTSDNTTLTFYYDNMRYSREGMTYNLSTWNNGPGWCNDGTRDYVTNVVFDPSFVDARPTSTYNWFYHMEQLQSISGMNYFNTSEVTDMGSMFNSCESLTSVDVSNFNTANVTDMVLMFHNCCNH